MRIRSIFQSIRIVVIKMDMEIDYNPTPSTHYFISIGLDEKEAISFDNTMKGFRVIKQVLVKKDLRKKRKREQVKQKKQKEENISGEWDAIVLTDGKFVKKYHVKWVDKGKFDTVNGETWETVWEKPISALLHEKLLFYSRFISDNYRRLERFPQKMKGFDVFLSKEIRKY